MTFTISFPIIVGLWFSFGILCIIAATAFLCRVNKVSPAFTFLGYFGSAVTGLMTWYMIHTVMNFAEALVKLGVLK